MQIKYLLIYVPISQKKWILGFLAEDLAKAAPCKCKIVYSVLEATIFMFRHRDAYLLCMHQSSFYRLALVGVPSDRLFVFYTHTRLDARINITLLNKLKSILCMNSVEITNLKLAGVDSGKLKLFPLGISRKLFKPLTLSAEAFPLRDIDFLFCLKYSSDSSHYFDRKNYNLIISCANRLVDQGYRVAIMGSGWEKAGLDKRIILFDLVHLQTPAIYLRSRIYISLSLCEGGPLSMLEAFCSGCAIVSYHTGFFADIYSLCPQTHLLPLSFCEEKIIDRLNAIHSLTPCSILPEIADRRDLYADSVSFNHLAKLCCTF